jgi:ABC-type polysaccharide/polyol phosphate export permease
MELSAEDAVPGLRRSWAIQRRVIWALVLREMLTRYGRHNIGFLWLFVEPMMFTLGVALLWSFFRSAHGSSLPIVAFALTGYSSVLLWRNMPSRCIAAIEPNLSLLYHRHVKIIDIYFSRLALEVIGVTISFVILSLLFISIDWLKPPEDILKVFAGWVMLAWFGGALAIFLSSLAYDSELVDKIWHPFCYLLFPLSGAAFLVDALPKTAQHLILYNPVVHGLELLREGYFGSAMIAHYDIGYMAGWCAALTLLGLARVRTLSKRVIPA